jgi:hypothetical protein
MEKKRVYPVVCQTREEIETITSHRYENPANITYTPDEINDVLINPHKGWCIHYYDNSITQYGDRLENDDLADIPGFTDVYLRLGWSYLEPEEGKFNWEIIEKPIRRWTALGKGISFRITCCEGDAGVGTPDWVRKAGAKGYPFGQDGKSWEPDYGDPIFLQKLENFLKIFAERYDGKPYVDYIDIGSYGIWGEWHTGSSSGKVWPPKVLKKHIDLHAKYFKKSHLIMQYSYSKQMSDYAFKKANAGLRCDSVCVDNHFFSYGGYCFMDQFENVWRTQPVVLEPGHYKLYGDRMHIGEKGKDRWQKGSTLRSAMHAHHASWLTIHHWPREWYNENRELTASLVNPMGYWFFLKSLIYPKVVKPGEKFLIQMNWENRGVAPIYKNYPVAISFKSKETGKEVFRIAHPTSDCRRWMPTKTTVNNLEWIIPDDIPAGEYIIRFGLVDDEENMSAKIKLGIDGMEDDLFYKTGEIKVEQKSDTIH